MKMENVSREELERAFAFLVVKVMDMDFKDGNGRDICPMDGFCKDEKDCFLDKCVMIKGGE